MPISVQDIDNKYVTLQCEGELISKEFFEANDYIYSKMDETVARYQIVDLRRVSKVALSADEIRELAHQDKNEVDRLERLVIAVVAFRDSEFGLSRMWELYADSPRIESCVFRDLTAAREWLLSKREECPKKSDTECD